MAEETLTTAPLDVSQPENLAPTPDSGKRRGKKARKARKAAKVKKEKKPKDPNSRKEKLRVRKRKWNASLRKGKTITQCIYAAMKALKINHRGGRGITIRAVRKQLARKRIYVALFVMKQSMMMMLRHGVVRVMVGKRRLKLTGKPLPRPGKRHFVELAEVKKRAAARRAAKKAAAARRRAAAPSAKKSRKSRKVAKKAKKSRKPRRKASKAKKSKKARKAPKRKSRRTKKLNSKTTIRSLIKMVRK